MVQSLQFHLINIWFIILLENEIDLIEDNYIIGFEVLKKEISITFAS